MAVRLCAIGCGWMMRANHAPVLRLLAERGDVELLACCDVTVEAAENVRQVAGFQRVASDAAAMLDEERPDAVVVAVPDIVAHAVGREVLSRGIPALLEKPPAKTLAELDDLIAVANEKRTWAQVALNRRFVPVLVEMKRRLAEAGPAHSVEGLMMRPGRRDADFTATAIHLVDAIRFVLGDNYHMLAMRYQAWTSHGAPVTNFYLDGTMKSGAIVQISVCPDSGVMAERIALRCAGRTIEAEVPPMGKDPHSGTLMDWANGRDAEMVTGVKLTGREEPQAANGVFDQLASFVRAVKDGRLVPVDLQSARQSMRVMLAMRERAGSFAG